MNSKQQNGGPSKGKPQTAPPNDPAKTTTIEHQRVCKEFALGICNKGVNCKYRHELTFDILKDLIKFCRYHQKNRCTRTDCPYLHASSEEERLFLSKRRIPTVLVERYAAMKYPPLSVGAEAGSQGPTGIYEYSAQLPILTATTKATVPTPLPTSQITHQPAAQNSHPVPSKPTPSTSAARYSGVCGPSSSASTAIMHTNSKQQSVLPSDFDPSRPPPPVPPQHGSLKRAGEPLEAGPSKVQKPDQCGRCQLEKQRDYEPARAVLKQLLSPPFMAAVDLVIDAASQEERGHFYELVQNLFMDRLVMRINSLLGFSLDPIIWDHALLDLLNDWINDKNNFNICCCRENTQSRYSSDGGASKSALPNASKFNSAAAIAQAVVQLYTNSIPGPSTSNKTPATPPFHNFQETQPPAVPQVQPPVQAQVQSPMPSHVHPPAPVQPVQPHLPMHGQPPIPRPYYTYSSMPTYAGMRPPAPSHPNGYVFNPYNTFPYQNQNPDQNYQ